MSKNIDLGIEYFTKMRIDTNISSILKLKFNLITLRNNANYSSGKGDIHNCFKEKHSTHE